jgi:hypothetical protein
MIADGRYAKCDRVTLDAQQMMARNPIKRYGLTVLLVHAQFQKACLA